MYTYVDRYVYIDTNVYINIYVHTHAYLHINTFYVNTVYTKDSKTFSSRPRFPYPLILIRHKNSNPSTEKDGER